MQKLNIRLAALTTIIVAAAFSRLIPHPANFSPMEAITLFAAAHFARRWQALLIPFAAMWLSSLVLNNTVYASGNANFVWIYAGFYWQYLSYALIAVTGFALFRSGVTVRRVVSGGFVAAALFFLVTNFGVWAEGRLYPQTAPGLAACYAAALPFLRGTLMGTAFYAAWLFGGFHLLQVVFPQLRQRPLAA